MSKLEQTLIAQARRAWHEMRAEIDSPTDVHAFTAAHASLYAFLELAKFDSGLSMRARNDLLEIEQHAARYLSESNKPKSPPPAAVTVVDLAKFRKK